MIGYDAFGVYVYSVPVFFRLLLCLIVCVRALCVSSVVWRVCVCVCVQVCVCCVLCVCVCVCMWLCVCGRHMHTDAMFACEPT